MKTGQPLDILVGTDLSSVEFVRDYLQLRFGGPCLTAVTDPYVLKKNQRYNRSDADFCNILISCIGLSVEETSVIDDDLIHIQLSGDCSINISLKPEDYVTVEAVIFDDGSGGMWIW